MSEQLCSRRRRPIADRRGPPMAHSRSPRGREAAVCAAPLSRSRALHRAWQAERVARHFGGRQRSCGVCDARCVHPLYPPPPPLPIRPLLKFPSRLPSSRVRVEASQLQGNYVRGEWIDGCRERDDSQCVGGFRIMVQNRFRIMVCAADLRLRDATHYG